MSTQTIRRFTPEEYLELERRSTYKSEYLDGQIYAMAGASLAHCRITANVMGELVPQLRGADCEVLSGDMKVRTTRKGLYSYPDLTVVCGAPQFHDEQKDVLLNPKVIFEILSPSTEAFDRGAKFLCYQAIESFSDYLLVAQDEARVEHLHRQADGGWLLYVFRGVESRVAIESINCTLTLAGIYERVEFTEQEEE